MGADFLLGLGTALSGAGQFAQGLQGFSPSTRNAPSGNTIFWQGVGERDRDRARADAFLQRRVRDATAAGLHPLFALGAASQSSPSFSVSGGGSHPGTGYADMGFGAGGIMAGLSRILKRKEKALARSTEADADRKELELEEARRRYRNFAAGAPLGVVPGVNRQAEEPVQPTRDWIDQVVHSDGDIIIPDIEDKLLSMPIQAARDYGRSRALSEHRSRTGAHTRGGRRARAQMHYDVAMGRKRLRKRLITKYGKAEGLRRFKRVISKQRAYMRPQSRRFQ